MFAAEVRALRPIAHGEVTMCYIPELERHSARHLRIHVHGDGAPASSTRVQTPTPARAHSDELPDTRIWAWARASIARDDTLLGGLEQRAAMTEQEIYVRPEGWLTVARPLVKIYCLLGNAVARGGA
jgi:hypothetical protein